ncbi:MAG: hypothetical protein EBQ96_03570 [Proteobacteria bacterium]|nr:hypothetical protein [Pseudomonadota bacterium]
MVERVRYFAVDEETFYTLYAPAMRVRFNTAAIDARGTPDRYLLMQRGNEPVVGYAKLFFNGASTYLGYIEIAKDSRNSGFGLRLYKEIFRRAAKRGNTLVISPYSQMGLAHLQPHQDALERHYYPHLLVENRALF